MAAPMNEVTRPHSANLDLTPRTLTGSQLIWEALVREGIDVVFG